MSFIKIMRCTIVLYDYAINRQPSRRWIVWNSKWRNFGSSFNDYFNIYIRGRSERESDRENGSERDDFLVVEFLTGVPTFFEKLKRRLSMQCNY